MTDTPDVQKIAEEAIRATGARWMQGGDHITSALAAAVLSAVEPVIRRKVAEEIAVDIEPEPDSRYLDEYHDALIDAAAIARSHATEEKPK